MIKYLAKFVVASVSALGVVLSSGLITNDKYRTIISAIIAIAGALGVYKIPNGPNPQETTNRENVT